MILQWCTEDYGILKTVAKGARRPASSFAGKTDLFFRCEIEIHTSKRGDLHILKDLAILETRLGLRRNYLQTLAASYFVKLIQKAAEPGTPIPELNDLLTRGLNYLDTTDADLKAVLHFERQLATILGIVHLETDPSQSLRDQFSGLPPQRGELISRLGN